MIYKYKIGDYVTRKKYNNDILFKINDISENNALLYGIDLRLCADAPLSDLKLSSIRKEKKDILNYNKLDKTKYFYIPGKILHIDADNDYYDKCIKYYESNNVRYEGCILKEEEMPNKINILLNKYNPDIIIITGHDSYNKNNKYKNSKYFIETVKKIRKISNKTIIISGACQSDFNGLIKAGSTFASSPKKKNIHALDPALIAVSVALCSEHEVINIEEILSKTKYGSDGVGGIIVKGKMKVGYPRIKE